MSSRKTQTQVCVTIIIVCYENQETIGACLSSIISQVQIPCEIIVVDNSVTPHTLTSIQDFTAANPIPCLTVLTPSQNLGFAAGCNRGAQRATGQFLLFLNPDTVLENDVCQILTAELQAGHRVGVTGPMVTDSSGRISKTCRYLPSLGNIFLDVLGIGRLLGTYRMTRFSHRYKRPVDQVIGACFCVSDALFNELGGFDERFFVYFEEVDFCKRCIDKGYRVMFCPEARLMHHAGVSCESPETGAGMIRQLRESRLLYFQKHFPPVQTRLMRLINRLEGVSRGVIFSFLSRTGHARQKEKFRVRAEGYLRVGRS